MNQIDLEFVYPATHKWLNLQPEELPQAVVKLLSLGYSEGQLARVAECSQRTIQRLWHREHDPRRVGARTYIGIAGLYGRHFTN